VRSAPILSEEIVLSDTVFANTVSADRTQVAITPVETEPAEIVPSDITSTATATADIMPAAIMPSENAPVEIISAASASSPAATAEIAVESIFNSSTMTESKPAEVTAATATTGTTSCHRSTNLSISQAEDGLSGESSKQEVAEENIVPIDVAFPAVLPPEMSNDERMSTAFSPVYTAAEEMVSGKRSRAEDECDEEAQPIQKKARQSVTSNQEEGKMVHFESEEQSETASPVSSIAKLRGDSVGSVDSGIGMGRTA
jgi:hypothetical protein